MFCVKYAWIVLLLKLQILKTILEGTLEEKYERFRNRMDVQTSTKFTFPFFFSLRTSKILLRLNVLMFFQQFEVQNPRGDSH